MIASRWVLTCCLSIVTTATLAENSFPPPTGPYNSQGSAPAASPEWAPDPSQPTPFQGYDANTGYGYPDNPTYGAPPAGYDTQQMTNDN